MKIEKLVLAARKHLPKPEIESFNEYTVGLNFEEDDSVKVDHNVLFEKDPREADGWRYVSYKAVPFFPEKP